jgi:hypothetical protein
VRRSTRSTSSNVITIAACGEYLHSDPGANKFGVSGFTPDGYDDFSEALTLSLALWDNLLTRLQYRFDDLSKGYNRYRFNDSKPGRCRCCLLFLPQQS